jgi:catechol 2,3-dioxygenase-like lactoylglutathione lyase family enzyme
MKRTWPIIAVNDVQESSRWYRQLLGCTNNHPGKETFDQLQDADGTVLLCLHTWNGEHTHAPFADRAANKPGHGVMLYFCVDDFDAALERARALDAPLDQEPHKNPNAHCTEFSLRDPDGYFVTISDFDAAYMQR